MAELIPELLDIIDRDVSEQGWSHVASDFDPADITAVKGLLSAIGERLVRDESVEPEISVIAPREKSQVLAGTSRAMSFHTDNVYLDSPCKSVALFCAVQAEQGGVNELVDGLAAVEALPNAMQDMLAEERWYWTHPATGKAAGPYAVFDREASQIRWWRMSLLNKEAGALAVADALEGSLNTTRQQSVLLQPGDILVTDNTRILHNRSAFVGSRRVYRARFW